MQKLGIDSEQKRPSPGAEVDSYPRGGTARRQTHSQLERQRTGCWRGGRALSAACTQRSLTARQRRAGIKGADHVLRESFECENSTCKGPDAEGGPTFSQPGASRLREGKAGEGGVRGVGVFLFLLNLILKTSTVTLMMNDSFSLITNTLLG